MSELETYRQAGAAGQPAAAAGDPDPDAAETRALPGPVEAGPDGEGSRRARRRGRRDRQASADLAPTTPLDPVPAAAGSELDVVGSGSDADLLAIPPRADDLAEALAAKPPRAKIPKLTAALCGAALVCVGFIGGALVQKHLGGGSSGRGSSSFASAFASAAAGRGGAGRSGFGGFGGAAGAGGAGGSITGTVTVVSGGTLYVTASNGSVYTVKTTGSTTVSVARSGSLSDLQPGESVTISGSNDGSGDVTATSITAGAPGASSSSGTTNATGGQ